MIPSMIYDADTRTAVVRVGELIVTVSAPGDQGGDHEILIEADSDATEVVVWVSTPTRRLPLGV